VTVVVVVVITPTPSPTPTLQQFPQPQLIAPPNLDLTSGEGHFSGEIPEPRLEWQPIPGMGASDFYVVSVSFPGPVEPLFSGASTQDPFWVVDQRMYKDVAGSQRDFTWSVVVSHFEGRRKNSQGQWEPVGEGVEVSPRSEQRVFRWD
jgi:hypothetical protein